MRFEIDQNSNWLAQSDVKETSPTIELFCKVKLKELFGGSASSVLQADVFLLIKYSTETRLERARAGRLQY